jgi:hypothetical protein
MKVKEGMREEGQRKRRGTVVGKIFRINRTKDKGLGNKKEHPYRKKQNRELEINIKEN